MITDSSATIVSKVWNYAHVLRNVGAGYRRQVGGPGDSVEVRAARAWITYLLFGSGLRPPGVAQTFGLPVSAKAPILKLADEMTDLGFYPPTFRGSGAAGPPTPKGSGATSNPIPAEFQWPELTSKSGDPPPPRLRRTDELEWSGATWTTRQDRPEGGRGGAHQVHYRHTLENFGTERGLVGIIFRKAQNKISNPSDLQRVIKMVADEDWSGINKLSPSGCSCVERSLGKGFELLQSAGPQSPYRNERTRVDFYELQGACHPLKTQDRPEQLHFLQQGSFSGPPLHDVLQGFIKVFRDDGTQHSEVLFVLPTGLVETEQAMAFALEKEDRVHDRYPIDGDGSLHHLFDSVLGNPKDARHEVHLPIAGATEREDPELAIRRGSALDQRAVIRLGFKVTKSGETHPDVAVLGREGTKSFEAVYGGFSTEVFRPEVYRLPTLEEINFPGGSKVSQKSEEVDESVNGRHHLPSDSARFSIFASLKKSSGKIEFSHCSIMGSSPAASRAASSRRDAAFSASRAFRSNGFFSDIRGNDSRPARGSQTRAASGMTASSLNPSPVYLS